MSLGYKSEVLERVMASIPIPDSEQLCWRARSLCYYRKVATIPFHSIQTMPRYKHDLPR